MGDAAFGYSVPSLYLRQLLYISGPGSHVAGLSSESFNTSHSGMPVCSPSSLVRAVRPGIVRVVNIIFETPPPVARTVWVISAGHCLSHIPPLFIACPTALHLMPRSLSSHVFSSILRVSRVLSSHAILPSMLVPTSIRSIDQSPMFC